MAGNWREKAKSVLPYIFLVVFGFIYDHWVDRLEEDGTDDGFTADLVVGGTAVTLTQTNSEKSLKKEMEIFL